MKRALIVAPLVLAAIVAGLAVWCAGQAARFPIAALATHAPRRTAMMLERERQAAEHGSRLHIDQRWIPLERVSPLLWRAILVAEDDAFFEHAGLDWREIRASAQRDLQRRRVVRGGSTVTQQLARNLFLGDARTPTRKLTEAFLAVRLERTLTKRRILELYVNLIEWGDGVFGAEAAAQRYFHVSASQLGPRQAVLLAAVIINPRRYSALAPAKRIQRRAKLIAGRLHRRGYLDDAQYQLALGVPPPAPQPTGLFGWLRFPWSPKPKPAAPADTGAAPATDTVPSDSTSGAAP